MVFYYNQGLARANEIWVLILEFTERNYSSVQSGIVKLMMKYDHLPTLSERCLPASWAGLLLTPGLLPLPSERLLQEAGDWALLRRWRGWKPKVWKVDGYMWKLLDRELFFRYPDHTTKFAIYVPFEGLLNLKHQPELVERWESTLFCHVSGGGSFIANPVKRRRFRRLYRMSERNLTIPKFLNLHFLFLGSARLNAEMSLKLRAALEKPCQILETLETLRAGRYKSWEAMPPHRHKSLMRPNFFGGSKKTGSCDPWLGFTWGISRKIPPIHSKCLLDLFK